MNSDPVVLGRIVGVFGVKGWVKVFSYTEPRDAILGYRTWQLQQCGRWRQVKLAESRRQGGKIVARIDGVNDRDTAAMLLDCDIGVAREALPATQHGEYYWRDLEGLSVVARNGQTLGTVAYLLETGANDVLVVQGETERLIPFVMDKVILGVDLDKGVIDVDWEWD